MKWGKIMMAAALLCTCFLVSCGGNNSLQNEPQENGPQGGSGVQEGTSTFAGNPILINLMGASALVLEDAESNNFKKVVEGGILEPVFEIRDSSGEITKDVNIDELLPKVSQFWQGPNAEVVVRLGQSIQINGTSCSLIYYIEKEDKTKCILNSGVSSIQFDESGNIYLWIRAF